LNALLYGNPAKIPFEPGWPRESTVKRWRGEGLPENTGWQEYVAEKINLPSLPMPGFGFGSEPIPDVRVDFRMIPWFEEKILEHKNGRYIIRDWMGAILEIDDKFDYTYIRYAKDFVTRRWIKCPVENYQDWIEMKKRYDHAAPQRVQEFTPGEIKQINRRGRFIFVSVNGPFWQLREWMGFEGLCEAMIERPDFVSEMIEYWQDFVLGVCAKLFDQGVTVDGIWISEDMAYKAHCMISPAMTREFLLPVYKKWISYFRSKGVKIFDMDSDGYVAELIPIWIEAGINVNDPVEAAAHNDINLYSEKYGKQMAYKGGVDKRAIAAGGRIIEEELKRIAPAIKRGGFIPSCDHGVPSDISLENFIYYCGLLAKYTGWL
jgi:uroporphyrinogen decarboxylase